MREPTDEMRRFEAGETDPTSFSHAEHVRLAFEYASRFEFETALVRFSSGLRALTRRIGRPEKYHATITAAFMALIAERIACQATESFEDFAADNPDLLKPSALDGYYPSDVLASGIARRTFVLPRRDASLTRRSTP